MCPACHEAMEERSLATSEASVDTCHRCGGVWFDWEDGDMTVLAREVPPAGAREMPRSGPGACPRCNRALVVEVFQGAAEVLRCGDCGGAFVPYPSIGKIAASTPADEREAPETKGFWARIVAALRTPPGAGGREDGEEQGG